MAEPSLFLVQLPHVMSPPAVELFPCGSAPVKISCVFRVAATADELALLGKRSLLGDVDQGRVQIIHVSGYHHSLGVLPRADANSIARIDACGATWLGRAQIGSPIVAAGACSRDQRLALRVRSGDASEIGTVTLADAADKK